MAVNFGSDLFTKVMESNPVASTAVPVVTTAPMAAASPKADSFESSASKKEPNHKKQALDKVLKYSGIAALAAVPVTAVIMHKVNVKNLQKVLTQNEALKQELNDLVQKAVKENGTVVKEIKSGNKALWAALAAFAGGAKINDILSSDQAQDKDVKEAIQKDITTRAAQRIQNIENTANHAADEARNAKFINTNRTLQGRYLDEVYGFDMLKGVDKKAGFNQKKYDAAIKKIQNAASDYLNGNVQDKKAPLKKGDTVWSITSEFAPIKEGGLGSVPVELQNNFEALGIKTPTFIPMYQKNGFAALKNQNGEYTYTYSGTQFKLDKIAEYKVHSYKSHDSKDEAVEVFVSTSKIINGKEVKTAPLVFIKNDEYFNGSIYSRSAKAEEPEKFAFFSKAVYEFAKAKLDPNSVKGLKIVNNEKYNELEAPKGFLLNDWQAAPMAAMARYKAPMENAYGGLKDDAAQALSDMRIMTIGHNAQYQGNSFMDNYEQTKEASENILNTLFDNFASDIVKHADTKAPYADLANTLIMNKDTGERHVSLLNMGVCLSDYFAPVSKNYAKELVEDNEQSHALQWALGQRDKSGSLVGIINGNDLKNIALEKVKDTRIKQATGLEFKSYNQTSSQEEVISARLENKKMFLNDFIKPFTNGTINPKLVERLENVGNTKLPEISDEELAQTPVFSFVHRLVEQKGVDIVTQAIKEIYDNWETNFPGKPKPIFYLAGEDGEGGQKRALIEKLKDTLAPEDANRVVFAHGFAPIHGFMAATDFFLMPSKFEPCGLTQSEAFAQGTPVIATATGGIVDTVVADGKKQTGILTDKLNAKGFYSAINEGLDVFFNNKPKYEQMVMNAVSQDFSWIQPNRQGPVYEYLDKFGIDRNTLPEKSELNK